MQLPSGQFFGAPLRQYSAEGLTLTLSRYPPQQRQPWHTHEHPTLFLPLQSPLLDRSRREENVLEPLTLVYHPMEVTHRSETGGESLTGFNIELSSDWLRRYLLPSNALDSYALLSAPTTRLTMLRLLHEAFFAPEPHTPTIHADVLEALTPLTPCPDLATKSEPPRWLRRVEAFLRDSPISQVSLRDAARLADVHPVYLARAFRAYYGCSVGDYLRRLRLLHASVFALQQGGALGEAAYEAGFADQSHFTRQFVRETGLRPSLLLKLRQLQ